jgi:DNA-binding PadR family transcriptional regulator
MKLSERAIGQVWSPARSQLYAVLSRLSKGGLARSRRVAQQTRPDKQLFRITAAGRRALDGWLKTVEPDDDAFYLKLFVGGLTTDDVLVDQVERFRDRQKARLEELRALDQTNTRTGHDYYHGFLLDLGLERARESIRWANRVLEELRR